MMTTRRGSWIAPLALVAAIASLALNLYLIDKVRDAERALAPFRPLLEQIVSEGGTVSSEVRIPAGTPLNLDIPIDERVVIRIDTIIPLDTRIVVPIRSPVGDYNVPVPIRGSIPVRTNLPVRFTHDFQLRIQTPEDIVIPVELQ